MNTVDALNVLGKALCGDSFEVKPGLTDAETILEIAKNYTGGSGSGSGLVVKMKINMTDGTLTADPLIAGLSLTDLLDATLEAYVTNGALETLAGIYKLMGVTVGLNNVIQMTSIMPGADGPMPLIFDYNSDTGEVTFVGNGD